MKKYMAFFLGNQLKLIDSYQFENFSLESLAKNLSLSDMKYTAQEFSNEKFDLMKKKGVYPYDYMDNFEKFNDENLPPKKEFFSILNNEDITDLDYKHAENVWSTFNLGSMGEYCDFYLKSDVLLLADLNCC